jgi:predicted metalloprotease with PDZ domain
MQCRAAIRGSRCLLAALLLCLALPALAQASRPFPGVIALNVDVTDVQRRIFRVVETIPAGPGRFELYYPQWLPGNHAPRGPIEQVAGLRFRVEGRELNWQRDPLNVYHLWLVLPAGTRQLQVEFQVTSPQSSEQGRVVVSGEFLDLQWNQVLLYPAGYRARDISVQATLQLPAGWKYATALTPDPQYAAAGSDRVTFIADSLEVLVDSPLFAGRLFKQYELAPGGSPAVTLNLFAEEAADFAATEAQLDLHRRLVREAYAALGAPRFDRYQWLVALTEQIGSIGMEHHRSSENTLPPAYFRNWEQRLGDRDQLAHEFTHSWNGKYRRPARLWTAHYNTPMQDDLLWVYEGLTQYYGYVLAARSGLRPLDFAREDLARVAATYDRRRPGRDWRTLEDTTYMPVIGERRSQPWTSWQRGEDYYIEGALLWLEVDMRIRESSRGARTLDDFSRSFFAAQSTEGWVSLYELQDVVRALDAVATMDWYALLRTRVATTRQPALEGIDKAGYRLVYNDKPNLSVADSERSSSRTDLAYSLGIVVSRENVLTEVLWGSPAFRAGLATATTVVAVNGRACTPDLLRAAVTSAASGGPQVELIVRNGDRFRTVVIDYRDGLRYPHLEPITGRPDRLASLFAPRTAP